jgi:hypothetical protein
VGLFDEPVCTEVATNARPGILRLMRNHSPGHAEPAALLEVVDAYLRFHLQDAEVKRARERLVGADERIDA